EATRSGRRNRDRLRERAVGRASAEVSNLVQGTRRFQHDLQAENRIPWTVYGSGGNEAVLRYVVHANEGIAIDRRLIEREIVVELAVVLRVRVRVRQVQAPARIAAVGLLRRQEYLRVARFDAVV